MTRHKYADILDAIASGKDVEYFSTFDKKWSGTSSHAALVCVLEKIAPERLRVKQKTIRIGDYDVPEPMRVAPEIGSDYFFVSIDYVAVRKMDWQNDSSDERWLKNGLIQATNEGAEKQLEALLSLTKTKHGKG